MIRFSFHGGHSLYSHGKGEPEDFVKKALQLRFISFGFTEHLPRPEEYQYPDEKGGLIRGLVGFSEYPKEIERLREKYEGKIDILCGVEIDYFPDKEKYIRKYLKKYLFDYRIGSVHFVHGIPIDYAEGQLQHLVEKMGSVKGAFISYYNTIQQMVKAGFIDIVGHFDLIKIYNSGCDDPEVLEKIKETLRVIKKHNVLLDINTSGYDKHCQSLYPSADILKEARLMDIDVTIGDDSHAPEQIGRYFDRAVNELKKSGYGKIVQLKRGNGRTEREYVEI